MLAYDNLLSPASASSQPVGEIRHVANRLADTTGRFRAMIASGQAVLDRRYGAGPENSAAGSGAISAPVGEWGALQTQLDDLEAVADHLSVVLDRLAVL